MKQNIKIRDYKGSVLATSVLEGKNLNSEVSYAGSHKYKIEIKDKSGNVIKKFYTLNPTDAQKFGIENIKKSVAGLKLEVKLDELAKNLDETYRGEKHFFVDGALLDFRARFARAETDRVRNTIMNRFVNCLSSTPNDDKVKEIGELIYNSLDKKYRDSSPAVKRLKSNLIRYYNSKL